MVYIAQASCRSDEVDAAAESFLPYHQPLRFQIFQRRCGGSSIISSLIISSGSVVRVFLLVSTQKAIWVNLRQELG